MVEQFYSADETVAAIRSIDGRWPAYVRTTPEDWSRKVQVAAFGEEEEPVTDEQYEELIDNVRKIRVWLKDFGNDAGAHADLEYRDAGHEIFWLEDEGTDGLKKYYISVEPKPWDNQLAVNLEPYSKFTVQAPKGDYKIHFNLNFDDSYYLLVTNGHLPKFEIDTLPRREMTRCEYALVSGVISDTVSHFGIDLSYAERKKAEAEAEGKGSMEPASSL